MKKKILVLCLVVVLAITAVTGATLAYFTDTDSAKNVMTTGNVDIKQHEEQRFYNDNDEFWTLGDFVQDQKLYPMVDKKIDGDAFMTSAEVAVAGDETTNVFNKLKNAIDKFVSVTNVGSEDAYVRTILAFETNDVYEANTNNRTGDAHVRYFLVNGTFKYLGEDENNPTTFEIDGTKYCIAVCVYQDAVKPEERTATSLRQVGLTWDADNEVMDLFGETYDILVLSQATQVAGFDSAEEALNEAFGEVTPAKCVEWFTDIA